MNHASPKLLASYLNGMAIDAVPISHRAMAYGDGVFETMRSVNGAIPLWPWHQQRLADSLPRLALALPDWQLLNTHLQNCAHQFPNHVIKLMVVAASQQRGYQRQSTAVDCLTMVSTLPRMRSALRLAISDVQLALQPRLAGIKHLNRLEQVLAMNQKPDDCEEVLLCSADQRVICASSANLFVALDGKLCTPAITDCGVAGVARALLIERLAVNIERIAVNDLARANAMFLTNAVRGVTEVATLNIGALVCQFPVTTTGLAQIKPHKDFACDAAVYARQTLAEVGFQI